LHEAAATASLFLSGLALETAASCPELTGGAAWVTRTPDLRITNAPLYRLS
jgi:hypothetical protein